MGARGKGDVAAISHQPSALRKGKQAKTVFAHDGPGHRKSDIFAVAGVGSL